MRSFSSRVMEAPGDCSPSRKVVSKMMSLSVMVGSGRQRQQVQRCRPASSGSSVEVEITLTGLPFMRRQM